MRLEPARHQLIGQINVLADRAVRESADLLEKVAPYDKRGADAKSTAPGILGRLEDIEEDALIVDPGPRRCQIVLDRIRIVEELRGLNDGRARIVEHADCPAENVAARREVRIEHEDQWGVGFSRRTTQSVVEIACFGAFIVGPRDVAGSDAL